MRRYKPRKAKLKEPDSTIQPKLSSEESSKEVVEALLDLSKTDNVIKFKEFLKVVKQGEVEYKSKKIRRVVRHKKDADLILPERMEEKLFTKRLPIYPEGIAYLFNLEGCAKKLFLYLLLCQIDQLTGRFIFNSSVISHFTVYCELNPPVYNETTVKQAMKKLREENIVLSLKRGENFVNPMITGGRNLADRIRLIQDYSHILIEQGRDTSLYFYPA